MVYGRSTGVPFAWDAEWAMQHQGCRGGSGRGTMEKEAYLWRLDFASRGLLSQKLLDFCPEWGYINVPKSWGDGRRVCSSEEHVFHEGGRAPQGRVALL
jgi:hypothetical protein